MKSHDKITRGSSVQRRFFPFKLRSVKPYSGSSFSAERRISGGNAEWQKRKRPLDTGDPAGAFFISSLQPLYGFVLLAKSRVGIGHVEGTGFLGPLRR